MPAPTRLLIVGTGAPGGIGRVEQLVAEAAADPVTPPAQSNIALWRRQHPDYLRKGAIEQLATVTAEPVGEGGVYVRELLRAVRAVKPDYVMYMHVNLARPAPWLRALGHPARFGVWTYGVEVWDELSRLHRHALQSAEVVMTISRDSVRRTVDTQGVPASRVRLVPLSLPEAMFKADDHEQAPEAGRLLTVSRLAQTERGKNIEPLIDAMPAVRASHPGAHLVIVGDGDDRERLEDIVRSKGLTEVVSFPGRLSDEELRDEYRRADLFVLPSEKEGFGLVFVEAMLTATPVVGFAKGGPLDIVRDGLDGRLIDDLSQLPGAIAALLDAPDALRRMGVQARDHARSSFGPTRFRTELATCLGRQPDQRNGKLTLDRTGPG